MAAPIETELKFAIDSPGLKRLQDHPLFKNAVEKKVLTLDSSYFDTTEESLRKAGISLRLRKGEAPTPIQTAKFSGKQTIGLMARTEVNAPLPARRTSPDLSAFPSDIAAAIEKACGGQPLERQFRIVVERHEAEIHLEDSAVVSLALDDGKVVIGRKSHAFQEVEFELKEQTPEALFALAKKMLPGLSIRLAGGSKATLGYRMKAGDLEDLAAPEPASLPALDGDMTVETALGACLRSCVGQIAANAAAVIDSADPEGPHQLRVGLRRLRSTLLAFRPVMDWTKARVLDEEAKRLATIVGELRDIDVLIDEIIGPLKDRVDVTGLVALLERRRERLRADVRSVIAGTDGTTFLIDLTEFTECREWRNGFDEALAYRLLPFAKNAIARQQERIAKYTDRLADLTAEERHSLRKAYKKLRYLLDFFAPVIGGKAMRKLLAKTKEVQDHLGYMNDVVMAEKLHTLVAEEGDRAETPGDPKERLHAAHAVGFILGWHCAQAEREWKKVVKLLG
ncbi:hypothetical protein HDIA_2746 [Hartmannibacter diazotrophicus]|uniref:CHAD domain-containing protein n=1 Tax=Hartmannibacter diazotrophicus TaxID=1482074 RepID=A0A2C9D7K3_9HYPH|nr:CHAD domain-containing protein [Hartmannibacter diazotrophicus]SON56287.1 hypothetical protein HDIA_2746 [Hartmannibacter diazotrophicus]